MVGWTYSKQRWQEQHHQEQDLSLLEEKVMVCVGDCRLLRPAQITAFTQFGCEQCASWCNCICASEAEVLVLLCEQHVHGVETWERGTRTFPGASQQCSVTNTVYDRGEDNQLVFLNVLVLHRVNGSVGHKLYRKPIHIDRYLHKVLNHHTKQKWQCWRHW